MKKSSIGIELDDKMPDYGPEIKLAIDTQSVPALNAGIFFCIFFFVPATKSPIIAQHKIFWFQTLNILEVKICF